MRFNALALTLLVLACASSDPLAEEGFMANPAGSGTWWVSYEADSTSSVRARDALLYNTARLVLDRGGVYFTFEEAKTDPRLERQQPSVIDDPYLGDPTGGESRGARTTLQRVTSVTAIAEIVDAPGENVLDASKVLAELTRKYTQ